MLRIGLKSDIENLTASLTAFKPDQLPYTIARALTLTAKQAQAAVRGAMPDNFILRRKEFLESGVLVEAATKDKLTAIVWDRDDFMARQESGDDKIPIDGGRNLAIPLDARPNPRSIIPEALRPANLGRAVYTISRKGNLITKRGTPNAAFRMVSNGNTYLAYRKDGKLMMMYLLIPADHITPRLHLADITLRVVKENFAQNFMDAARVAMETRIAGKYLTDKVDD